MVKYFHINSKKNLFCGHIKFKKYPFTGYENILKKNFQGLDQVASIKIKTGHLSQFSSS